MPVCWPARSLARQRHPDRSCGRLLVCVVVEVFGLDGPMMSYRASTSASARSRRSADGHQGRRRLHHHPHPRTGCRRGLRPGHRGGHPDQAGRRIPARSAPGDPGSLRGRGDHAQPVLGFFRPRCSRSFGRSAVHHALDVRRRPAPPPSGGAHRSAGVVRRRRRPDHQRRNCGRDRCLPASGTPRVGHRRRHQDRQADGGAAAAGRRPAAVRRDAHPRVHRRQPGPPADLGGGAPRRAAQCSSMAGAR